MMLIIGATGQLGSSVIENLVETPGAENIIALARDRKKAGKWDAKGIQIRIGDYEDKNSLYNAFQGVEKLLLISSNSNNPL